MTPSLTVVVPLWNSQSTLPRLVDEMLEVLPELTADFEVVLVDDGSTDATVEVAQELSLHFPQVLLLVHPARLGAQEALRSALRYGRGEAVLVCREEAEFDPHEIHKLWSQLTADGAPVGSSAVVGHCTPAGAALGAVPRLPAKYPSAAQMPFPDVLLAPRRLLVGWQQAGDRQDLLPYLKSRGYAIPSVALRNRRQRRGMAAIVAGLERRLIAQAAGAAGATGRRAPAPNLTAAGSKRTVVKDAAMHPAAEKPKGPSFLMSRLRALTWGE